VARQIGVNKDTIYNWETNRTAPEVQFIPRIIDFLGYVPYNPGCSFGQRLKAIRLALGLSERKFAKKIGVDQGAVGRWGKEEHRRRRRRLEDLMGFAHTPA
jgi:transcriptional regulator with XRE-family HTH domain